MGGQRGGIPEITKERTGVTVAVRSAYRSGRKNAATAMGQNMGRKMLPTPKL